MSHSMPDFVDPALDSPYNYVPSKTVALIMLGLFGLSSLAHTGQGIYHKTWFILPTAVLCGILELVGWAGRLWSHSDPSNSTPFQIQITCTILAPTPLLAATFVIFGRIMHRLGTSYGRLSAKLYTIIFCTCDFIALVVQGIGGGLAASADGEKGEDPEFGGHIMLGGVIFQLVVISVFTLCAVDFMWRYQTHRPVTRRREVQETPRGVLTPRLKLMMGALGVSTVALFIRAIYRTIELVDGWNGRIISTELYFNVLDGAMVVLAMYLINFFHPGLLVFNEHDVILLEKPLRSEESTLIQPQYSRV